MQHRVEVTDQGLTRSMAVPPRGSKHPSSAHFIGYSALLVRLGSGLARIVWERSRRAEGPAAADVARPVGPENARAGARRAR